MQPSTRRRPLAVAGDWALGLLAAASAAGCASVVDPPLPGGAVQLAPPAVYARWWGMTEACSGLTRDLGAVTWYVVPGASTFPNGTQGEANGYYSKAGNRIVLAGEVQLDGGVVRHEMLHALLEGQAGHPRAQFLGRCAGVVRCEAACVRDAGPAPAPAAGARVVAPSTLIVGAAVSPATPRASEDGGWFTLMVTATNTTPAPVVVTLTPSGTPVSFGYTVTPDPPPPGVGGVIADGAVPAWDASAAQFAPGETKQFVFDFRVDPDGAAFNGLGPGRYRFRGMYGGPDAGGAATTPVVLAP